MTLAGLHFSPSARNAVMVPKCLLVQKAIFADNLSLSPLTELKYGDVVLGTKYHQVLRGVMNLWFSVRS